MVVFEKFPNVKLVKFPELDEVDLGVIQNSLAHFLAKVGGDASLQLSLKEYAKGGLKAQHEVHGKVSISGKTFFAEHETWQLLESVQSVLKKLEKEVAKEEGKKK
ncbi:MAG: hypothetical protein WCW13_00815 [archaeon]|jgi:ribosome-associated translation inhibitor RaiA